MTVNEYVYTEKYVQQYVRKCSMQPDIDPDSDDCILITSVYTTVTCKARIKPKQKAKTKPLNLKSLQNTEKKKAFVNMLIINLRCYNAESQSPIEISMGVIKILSFAGQNTLPPLVNQKRCNEIWKKYDQEFNQLLSQCQHFLKLDVEYNTIT